MNSKVLASGIVTVNRWYPVAYRGYPQREIFNKSRKHVYATGQYDGLSTQQGIPHEPSCAVQIPLDQVYIRPLTEYAQFAEAT